MMGSVVEANRRTSEGPGVDPFRFARLAVGGENHAIQAAQIRQERRPIRRATSRKEPSAPASARSSAASWGPARAPRSASVGGAGAVVATRATNEAAGELVTTTLRAPLKVLVPADRCQLQPQRSRAVPMAGVLPASHSCSARGGSRDGDWRNRPSTPAPPTFTKDIAPSCSETARPAIGRARSRRSRSSPTPTPSSTPTRRRKRRASIGCRRGCPSAASSRSSASAA